MARFMIKASEYKNVCKSVNDRKLAELKKEIIEILKKQDEKEVKKAIDYFNSQELHYTHLEKSFTGKWVEKAGYGIGTVRIWKGKKYKKIAPGKWARVFEKEGRGTNIAIGKLIARVQKIDNVEDLMAFVMQNKQRFVDENGVDLPVLDKLRAAVDARNGNVGSKESQSDARKQLIKLEKKRRSQKDSVDDNSVRLEQAKLLRDAGFGSRKEFDDYLKKEMPTENDVAEENYNKFEDIKAALKEVEDAIDNAGDYDDVEELEKERKQLLKKLGKKPAEKKKTFKQEMNELYDAQDKAWEGFESGSEIKSTPENSKKFYDKVKKFVDDNNIKLSQKHYDEIEEMNGHSFNEALELAGAYGAEKREKAIAKNKEINKKYKGAMLDLSMIDEFKESDDGNKTYWIQDSKGNRITSEDAKARIKAQLNQIDSFNELIAERSKADGMKMEVAKRSLEEDNKYLMDRLNPEDRKEIESEAEKHQNRSDAMKGNKNAYKGGHDDEPVHNKVSKNGVYYTFDGFSGGLNRSFRQAKDLPQNIKDNINNSVKRYLDYVDNYTNEGYKKVADDMVKNPEKYQHMSMEEFTKETGYDKEDAREIINLKVSMEFADKFRNFNLDETMISKDAEQNFRDEIYPVSLKQNIQEGFLPNQIADIESQKVEKTEKKEKVAKRPSGKIATSNPDKLKPISSHEKVADGKVKMPYSKELSEEVKQLVGALDNKKKHSRPREFFTKVYYDNGNLVASDGYSLKIIKVGELDGINNGSYVDIDNSKDGITITENEEFTKDYRFANYKRVIPDGNKEKVILDNKALISKIKELKKDGSVSNKDPFVTFDVNGNDLMLDGVKVGDVSAANFEGDNSDFFNMDANILSQYLSGDTTELITSTDTEKPMYIGNDSAVSIIMPQTKYERKYDSNGTETTEIRRKNYESLREDKKLGDEAKANKKAAQKLANKDYVDGIIDRYKRSVPANFEEKSIEKLKEWTTEQLQRMYKVANADIDSLMEKKDFNSNTFSGYSNKHYDMSPERLIGQNYAMKEHPAIVKELERLLEERGVKVEKSLFGDFITDMLVDEVIEDEEEVEEDETEYNDYSAEQPELFNSTEFLVREALNRRYNCM